MSPRFDTTQWGLVISARDDASQIAKEALSELCQRYWRPVFAYVRTKGFSEEDAKDLTQEFFCDFVDRRFLRNVSQEKGLFRSFVIASVDNFIANEWRRRNTLKRGKGKQIFSIDASPSDWVMSIASSRELSPEQIYEQHWALNILDIALQRLESEFSARKASREFSAIRDVLTGSMDSLPYREIAEQLDKTEGAVKVMVHRARKRYGQLLREEVAHTVCSGDDVESEIRHLFDALDP